MKNESNKQYTGVRKQQFVWHDCDPGFDDALALIMLTAGQEMYNCKLIGVSTVGGNSNIDCCTVNARKILKMSKHEGSHNVYPGADRPLVQESMYCPEVHGVTGLDGTTTLDKVKLTEQKPEVAKKGSAIQAMYKGIMGCPKDSCWLLCTGPLTNAALLLGIYGTELCQHLAGLCFMGGAVALGNNNSSTEFNIAADPDAAKIVIESWGAKLKKLVMVPLDVTFSALTTNLIRQRIKAIGSTLSKTVDELLQHCIDRYADQGQLSTLQDLFQGQCEVHDACAVFYIWEPEMFQGRMMRVDVETASSFMYGTTCCDIYSSQMYGRRDSETKIKNCYVTQKINVPAFWNRVIKSIEIRSNVKDSSTTRSVKVAKVTKCCIKKKEKKQINKKTTGKKK